MNTTDTPRIYVACLASYNAGTLHGAWIDAAQDADDITAAIAKMLRESPCPNVTIPCPNCDGADTSQWPNPCAMCKGRKVVPSAEEWAVHDLEGFGGLKLGEYPDIETVASLAELIEEHGEDVVAAASDVCSSLEEIADTIADRYRGEYKSPEDFAEEFVTECHDLSQIPEFLRYHIDWEGVAHDYEVNGDFNFIERGGSVYVFHNG
jgi:antirestriction protein